MLESEGLTALLPGAIVKHGLGHGECRTAYGAVGRLGLADCVPACELLLHLGCGYSLRETAVRARKGQLAELTVAAVWQRLRKARDWLHALCRELWSEAGVDVAAGRGPKQLERYINEFAGQHNYRIAGTLDQMELIVWKMVGKRKRYKDLPKDNGLDSGDRRIADFRSPGWACAEGYSNARDRTNYTSVGYYEVRGEGILFAGSKPLDRNHDPATDGTDGERTGRQPRYLVATVPVGGSAFLDERARSGFDTTYARRCRLAAHGGDDRDVSKVRARGRGDRSAYGRTLGFQIDKNILPRA